MREKYETIFRQFVYEGRCHQLEIIVGKNWANGHEFGYDFSFHRKPINFDSLVLTDLPCFLFKSLDHLLQCRLYQISFPATRKHFWTVSKTTTNLGQKPTTYAVLKLSVNCGPPIKAERISPGNYVMNLQYKFAAFTRRCNPESYPESYPFSEVNFIELYRFFEMNYIEIYQQFSLGLNGDVIALNSKALKYFFNSRIKEAGLNCQFDVIFKMLPNLERLDYYGKAPTGWEKLLPKHEIPLCECIMWCSSTSDPAIIHEFMSFQKSITNFQVQDVAKGFKKEFNKYFKRLSKKSKKRSNKKFYCEYLRYSGPYIPRVFAEEFQEQSNLQLFCCW